MKTKIPYTEMPLNEQLEAYYNELKTYNVKVVNKMAVGVWPREEVKSEYKSLSYNQALSIKEIWSNAKDYNVVIKENVE